MTTRVYSENLKQKVTFLSKENMGSITGYELGSFIVYHNEEVQYLGSIGRKGKKKDGRK